MNDHYYTRDPASESKPVPCVFSYRGQTLNCLTDAGVFSKGELDKGTRLLLDALPELRGDVLDVGCGWGAIGLALAKAYPACRVVMLDVNRRALSLCERNAAANGVSVELLESDGLRGVAGRRFDAIVTNPPIRAGKQVVYGMLAGAARALNPGGALYLVIRKQQGAESCEKYLRGLFGRVDKLDKSGGFWVLRACEPLKEEASDEL